MRREIENIAKELESLTQIKELEISDIIRDVPQLISVLEEGFIKLRNLVSDYKFDNNADEINFFKEIKPKLFSKLIYYRKIYYIEINRPVCVYSALLLYFEKEQDCISKFSEKYIDFIQYYRSGQTILDEYYFLRGRREMELNLESFYFERDPKFSTNFDFKVARILANDMLAAYLNNELLKLKQHEHSLEHQAHPKLECKWTDTKNALVELIYAIHTENSVNNGSIDLKVLATMFEKIFNIELGDIYRIFLEIRGRKGNRTIYLNKLIEALNKRMDDADSK